MIRWASIIILCDFGLPSSIGPDVIQDLWVQGNSNSCESARREEQLLTAA